MKTRLLLLFFLITLLGCHDDEKIPLLKEQSFQLDSDEHLLRIGIRSGAEWRVTGDSVWCKIRQVSGDRMDSLLVQVDVNLIKSPRETVLKVSDGSEVGEIQIRQAGATEEYHYKLPTVFHIFSFADDMRDIKLEDRLLNLLEQANDFFGGKNRTGIDVKLEFVPITTMPLNNTPLVRPGIHWQYHENYDKIEPHDFLDNVYGDAQYLWDPNKYINIYVFNFYKSANDGVSALPWTPENNALEGLLAEDRFYREFPDDFVPAVLLNRSSIYKIQENPFLDMGACTLNHELGHYLGLYHAFEEDFCEETLEYDIDAYYNSLIPSEPWEEKIKRISLDGTVFISTNFEDYEYGYSDEITPDQRQRMRHVLNYSPMIPGPKIPVKLNVKSKSEKTTSHVITR